MSLKSDQLELRFSILSLAITLFSTDFDQVCIKIVCVEMPFFSLFRTHLLECFTRARSRDCLASKKATIETLSFI